MIFSAGFKKTHSDHSLFIRYDDKVFLSVLVYVDDILIIGNSDAAIDDFKSILKATLVLLNIFLGLK